MDLRRGKGNGKGDEEKDHSRRGEAEIGCLIRDSAGQKLAMILLPLSIDSICGVCWSRLKLF